MFTQPIVDALVSVDRVDLAVAYGVEVGGRTLAVAAFTLREGRAPRLAEISDAFEVLPPALRPDIIQVVEDIPLGSSYRPNAEALSAAGLPKPGTCVVRRSGIAAVQATDQGGGRGVSERLGRGACRCAVT